MSVGRRCVSKWASGGTKHVIPAACTSIGVSVRVSPLSSFIQSFIHDKEYELIKERAGRIDHLGFKHGGICTCHYTPAKGQRLHESVTDLATIEVSGIPARGTRIGDKPTQKVVVETGNKPAG